MLLWPNGLKAVVPHKVLDEGRWAFRTSIEKAASAIN